MRNLNWQNVNNLLNNRKFILPLAFSYFKKYGLVAFCKRVYFTLRTGNLQSSYSSVQQNRLDTLELIFELNPKVLLVTNDNRSPSHAYRIGNFSQAYWEMSIKNSVLDVSQISRLPVLPRETEIVIFWRTSLNLLELPWYENAKMRGVRILYDNDDLTFDSAVYTLQNVHGLQIIPLETSRYLTEKVCLDQELQIRNSDLGIACTPRMVESYSKFNIASKLIPIVIPRWMERQSHQIRRENSLLNPVSTTNKDNLKIIYASGSPSHGEDFKSCFGGVIKFLSSYPNSTLSVLGAPPFTEADIPNSLRSQVSFMPMVPHEELLFVLEQFDVQLAPLEVNNPFVEAKSATKFMHGGLLGIPTIASPTLPFRSLITNGKNGLLASSTVDWFEALELLRNSAKRVEIGLEARNTVLQKCTIDSIKPQLAQILSVGDQSNNYKDNSNYKPKNIYWLVPDFSINSGGTRNIFNMALLANQAGFESKIIYHNSRLKVAELQKLTRKFYGFETIPVYSGIPAMETPFAVVAVHHSSVPWMKSYAPPKSKLVYLVQDFEPYFYPMSETYINTLSTYFDTDLQIITSLRWMSEKIQDLTGREVPYLEFPMDKEIYKLHEPTQRDGIIFYAKEDTPRRLYDLGAKTLRIINQVDSSIPITLYGGGSTPSGLENVTNHFSNLSNEELSSQYNRHKVGLAFGPTNPSGIPYEMMACGLPVVDVTVPGETQNKYFDELVHLYSPEPATLATEILKLINFENHWRNLSLNGLNFINKMQKKSEIQEVLIRFFHSL
jgi:glycosyltransferase involved in cell wall biosynthesis